MTASAHHMEQVGARYRMALEAYLGNESMMKAIRADVDAFFERYPDIERIPLTEEFIAGLALDRITSAALSAESVPTASAQPRTTKVA